MSKQQPEKAIARFRAIHQVSVNDQPIYATYTSGSYNAFYATREEAIAHCSNPENGAEHAGGWLQDRYDTYQPGELFTVAGNEAVYESHDYSRHVEPIGGRHQMSFVTWRQESPFAA